MVNSPSPEPVSGLAELAPHYRYLLCDAWGVVHNGVAAYAEAGKALRNFRESGGKVLILTNAPRPGAQVIEQLDRWGLDRAAYDGIVTSGEAARDYIAARPGARILYVGPERDLTILAGLPVEVADEEEADFICCTGLMNDNQEIPDDYAGRFARWLDRGLTMLCANPDIVVERGERLVWCAGALAVRYAALGGEIVVVGKPHAPIYEAALARLSRMAGREVKRAEVLAIGDGMETDIRGAVQAETDVLFVTGGIHAEGFGPRDNPDRAAVHAMLANAGLGARAFVPRLMW